MCMQCPNFMADIKTNDNNNDDKHHTSINGMHNENNKRNVRKQNARNDYKHNTPMNGTHDKLPTLNNGTLTIAIKITQQ